MGGKNLSVLLGGEQVVCVLEGVGEGGCLYVFLREWVRGAVCMCF